MEVVWYWCKDRQTDQWNRTDIQECTFLHMWLLDYIKALVQFDGERMVFSANWHWDH